MNTIEMDHQFADGVRAELAAIGTGQSVLQRHQRRSRTVAIGVGAVLLAGATTGAAIAVNSLPGATTVVPLGNPVTVTNTGAATIDLGAIPANATSVVIDFTCVSDDGFIGVRTTSDGDNQGGEAFAGSKCTAGRTSHFADALLPTDGSTAIAVSATPGTTWTATAQYATSTATGWGVNERGQTFGVANINGAPDLTAMRATNGEWGYVFTNQYSRFDSGLLAVYASDGWTVVGHIQIVIDERIETDLVEHFVIDDFFENSENE